MHTSASLRSLFLSLTAAGAVTACGGGGSDSPPPPPAQGVTLTGVVATGAAVAGATVEARCKGGSTGSATSAANGSYSISIGTGSLPCVVRATPAGGGTVLHSVAHGSGTAHITPASQLIVASFAGMAPSAFYAAFTDTVADALTSARVQAAHASIVAVLTNGGVNFSALGNLLTGTLTAPNGGTPGNAYDQALDALAQRLATRGLTLAALTDVVIRTSSANTTATTNTPSLPPQSLLQPASATCPALRSGPYRLVIPQQTVAGQFSTGVLQVDAVAGTTLNPEGDTGTFTSAGTCIFNSENGQFVVSASGIIVLRSEEEPGVIRMGIAFPEQAHAVADLAGTYQKLGFERADGGSTYGTDAAIGTINTTGTLSNISYCEDVIACAPVPGVSLTIAAHSAGGFTLSNGGQSTDRFYAYRAGNGDLLLVDLAGNGSFGLWTPQRVTSPVALGVRQQSWGTWSGSNLQSTAVVSTSDFTVTASDATTWTRVAVSDGHSETLTANSPRNGWVSRPEGNAPVNGGGTVLVRGFEGLVLRGMGMTALSIPSLGGGAYFISVNY